MRSYLRTYTTGALYERVTKTDKKRIFEFVREVVHRGRNRNANVLVALKAQALTPPVADKPSDLDKTITEWEDVQERIRQQEPEFAMNDDTKKTILIRICPKEFVKDLRDKYNSDKSKDYHELKQDLDDDIMTRKMDSKERSTGGLNEVRTQADPQASRVNSEPEYYEESVWVEEMQAWVCGLAAKRPADDGGDGPDEAEAKKPRFEPKGTGKRGGKDPRGPRPQGPCWTCGGPHMQRDCPEAAKGGAPTSTAWAAWRPSGFPGPTPTQWRAWMPKQTKGKGKGKGKGKSGKGGKGIAEVSYPTWGPALGQVQAEWTDGAAWDMSGVTMLNSLEMTTTEEVPPPPPPPCESGCQCHFRRTRRSRATQIIKNRFQELQDSSDYIESESETIQDPPNHAESKSEIKMNTPDDVKGKTDSDEDLTDNQSGSDTGMDDADEFPFITVHTKKHKRRMPKISRKKSRKVPLPLHTSYNALNPEKPLVNERVNVKENLPRNVDPRRAKQVILERRYAEKRSPMTRAEIQEMLDREASENGENEITEENSPPEFVDSDDEPEVQKYEESIEDSDSGDEDAGWLDELLNENDVKESIMDKSTAMVSGGVIGIPTEEPRGEIPWQHAH